MLKWRANEILVRNQGLLKLTLLCAKLLLRWLKAMNRIVREQRTYALFSLIHKSWKKIKILRAVTLLLKLLNLE